MNRIKQVHFDMNERWANRPQWNIEVDHFDDSAFRYQAVHLQSTTAYIAVSGDLVSFIVHIPANENGYASRVFDLPMIDGSVRSVRGPWSSSASDMSRICGIGITDCYIITSKDRFGPGHHQLQAMGGVLTNRLLAECMKQGIPTASVTVFNKWFVEPAPDGVIKKPFY